MRLPSLGLAVCFFGVAACVGDGVSGVQNPDSPDGSTEKVDPMTGPDGAPATTTSDGGTTPGNDASPIADGGASDGSDGAVGPTNYCATAVAPPSSNFFCVDFDGMPRTTGWTNTSFISGSGTWQTTSAVYYSPANAVAVYSPATTFMAPANARNVWSITGPKAIAKIEAEFYVNPQTLGGVVAPKGGTTDLAQIGIPGYYITFGMLEADHTAAGGVRSYGVCEVESRSAAFIQCEKIATALPAGIWTRVKLTLSAGGGNTSIVRYNDLPVVMRSMSTYTATQADIHVGSRTNGDTNEVRMRYDNIVGTVTRDP